MLCTNRNVGSDGQVSPVFSALFLYLLFVLAPPEKYAPCWTSARSNNLSYMHCSRQQNAVHKKKIKSCHAKFWFLAACSKLVPDMGGCPNQSNFSSTSHQFVVKVPDSRVLGSRFTFIVSPRDHAIKIHAFHHRARVMQIDKCWLLYRVFFSRTIFLKGRNVIWMRPPLHAHVARWTLDGNITFTIIRLIN